MIYEWTIEEWEWKQEPGRFVASSIRMVCPGEYRPSKEPGKVVEVVKEQEFWVLEGFELSEELEAVGAHAIAVQSGRYVLPLDFKGEKLCLFPGETIGIEVDFPSDKPPPARSSIRVKGTILSQTVVIAFLEK